MAWGATFSGFENVYAGSGNDLIAGNDADNELHGGDGADELNGYLGNDKLYGGDGDDILSDGDSFAATSHGADQLYGEDGDDLIYANYADVGDIYDGGADVDTLNLSADASYFSGSNAIDLRGPLSDVFGRYFMAFGAKFYNF